MMNGTQTDTNSPMRQLGALALIGVGALFLLTNVFGIEFNFWGMAWPFFVIIPGAVFLWLAFTGGKNAAGFVFPGAIIGGTGLILLAQNLTDYWESWAYVWTLYPVFVGAAMTFHGQRLNDQNTRDSGRKLMRGGLIAFLALGAMFELFIFERMGGLGNVVLPLLLIGGGVFLLRGRRSYSSPAPQLKTKRKNDADINPELQRQIDEALSEDEPEKV
jgi:hypothetical protein